MSFSITHAALVATLLGSLFGATACSDDGSNDLDSAIGESRGSGGSAIASGASGSGSGTSGSSGLSAAAGAGGSTGTGGAAASGEFPAPDKIVALSFDDGPSVTATPLVLDKLEAHGVPASFFLIGQNITAETQPVLQRAAALGCEFENHSFGYAALTGQTREAIETSVDDTVARIEQFTNTTPVFFRPPNLAVDAQMYEVIDYPFAGGLVAGDFPAQYGGNPTVEAVTNAVLNGVQDGTIILLHDVQPELNPHPTPEALDTILPELKRRGFEIVTLQELFERKGVDPNSEQDQIWSRVPR